MFDGEVMIPEWMITKHRKTSVVQMVATVVACVISIATLLLH